MIITKIVMMPNYWIFTADLLDVLPIYCRSQRPCGLRRRSLAARLLRSWIRILEGHGCLSAVSVVCYHVEVSATD
jgi:hypothetical protein